MKVLCVEDGSIDIDAVTEIESQNLINGKVLVYRQGSRPPFVIDIPNLGMPRAVRELQEVQAMLQKDMERYGRYSDAYHVFATYNDYVQSRLDCLMAEIKENTQK